MNAIHPFLLSSLVALAAITPAVGDDGVFVNGYTYVAPSTYLTPPVVIYDPFFAVPAPTVIAPVGYFPPVVYAEPAFVSQTVVPLNPTWNYPPAVVGPSAYRARARFGRHGMDYTYHEYIPGRAAPVYTYRVNPGPHGVRVRERVR